MEMLIDDTTFDIDNVDIEEQMNAQDIEEEELQSAKISERRKRIAEAKVKKKHSTLITSKKLYEELNMCEVDRPEYKWQKDGKEYVGRVIYCLGSTTFLFTTKNITDGETEYVTRKFKLSEIKQNQIK